jgi:hypothetical protein
MTRRSSQTRADHRQRLPSQGYLVELEVQATHVPNSEARLV